jgi:hypothetical protein
VVAFVSTRFAMLKHAVAESPRAATAVLAIFLVVTVVPGPGAVLHTKRGVEVEGLAPGSLAERIGVVVGDTTDR